MLAKVPSYYSIKFLDFSENIVDRLNISKIYTISDLINAIKSGAINDVPGIGKKEVSKIINYLFELGYFITTNDKIIYVFNDVGEIFEISNYTKNYLIYKYNLNKKDVDELERIMNKYDIKYKSRDIIDEGLDKKISHLLYNSGVLTTNELYRAYNFNILSFIKGIGKKSIKEIEDFLNI